MPSTQDTNSKETADLLQSYRNALVKSSASDVIKLYAPDALLMAQGFPIVCSAEDILTWYENCFKNITLDVVFEIKEIMVVSDEYAFATTTSAGTQKDNASGKVTNEGNHELFVIQKVDRSWKIGRYCFSTTKT
ncbi:Ketosteroid isomerase-like protein [Cladophialophora carrionii]|uniref:Ketosteroid isomerase-like protein n=1 Tax=Cladophialophora carrionii TaxID=86049 RepID=A0A1C1CWC9_9EURO|nr:Ketosteroid isomerase-like protein [Cladophialophora carrionii]